MPNLIRTSKFQFTNSKGVVTVSEVLGMWYRNGRKYQYDLCDLITTKGLTYRDNYRTVNCEKVDIWIGKENFKVIG